MKRNEFLTEVHEAYRPRSYLEIGIAKGGSLALSRTRTIAVDPDFRITAEIQCDIQVVKATSDEFFARENPLGHFPHPCVDLAFVDGLHLFEFALRDFMNVERHADWTSVIVIDDVLPRNAVEASRERGSMVAWTGDVFKLTDVLSRYRPDLLLLPLDTLPAGDLLVLGANPWSSVLEEHYDEIVAEYVSPDPQRVPEAVLRRENAIDPSSVAEPGLWGDLRNARDSGVIREDGWDDLRRSFETAARSAALRELTPPPEERGETGPPPTVSRGALASTRRRLRPLRRRLRRLRRPAGGIRAD